MTVGDVTSADLRDAVAAALQRHPGAVVSGLTAAVMLGAVDPDDRPTTDLRGLDPVDLTRSGGGVRSRTGVRLRRDHLDEHEIVTHEVDAGLQMRITSPTRTAFDVARRLPTVDAVVVVEALSRGHGVTVDGLRCTAEEHPHARGLVRLWAALPLVEEDARSAFESRVRMALLQAGLAAPVVGHCVVDEHGTPVGVTDLAWPEERCALLCDRDLEKASDMAGALVFDGWTIQRVSPNQWEQHAELVVERAGHMLRGARRRHGLDRPDYENILGLKRPRRERRGGVRVFP